MPPIWVMWVAPVGVLGIILLTWMLEGRSKRSITDDGIRSFLRRLEPPVRPRDSCIGADGQSALVLLEDGRLAVVCLVGDGLAFRLLEEASAVSSTPAGFEVRFPGLGFRAVIVKRTDRPLPGELGRAMEAWVELAQE